MTLNANHLIADYINRTIGEAEYDKLVENSFTGSIPSCKGVVAFGPTLKDCEGELRSSLEEWILLGLKLGHSLPVVDGIDLNKEPEDEPMEAV